jgi:predicted component of type VI protein secretion system
VPGIRPTLVLRQTGSGQTWSLTDGRMVVGRKDALAQAVLEPGELALPLDDRLVSRRHAIIRADDGEFTVTDAGSTDGTHLNEQEITGTIAIAAGDRLRFGDTVLIASVERPTPPIASAAAGEADADRTVFQAPLVSRRPPDAPKPQVPRPPESPSPQVPRPPDSPSPLGPRSPDSPTPMRSAAPQTHPRVGPVPITPAPVDPPTPMRAPRPVLPGSEPAMPPAAPSPPPAPPPPSQPVMAGAEAPPATGLTLSDVTRATSELSASVRRIEHDVSAIVDLFERAGGRPALLAFVAQARRLEANPSSTEELDNLIRWLPTACRMLETELLLLSLLSPQASNAPR